MRFRAARDLVGDFPQIAESELGAEPLQLAAAGPAGRHLGAEVADHLLRIAHVAADQAEQLLVRLAALVEAQHRDDQALLENLLGKARALAPADVHMVDRIDGKTDQAALVKRRRGDEDVRRLAVAEPGIVADENVARHHRLRREGLDEIGAEGGHAAGMAGGAEPGLRHQMAAVVEQARRHVVHLDHVVAEGGAEHRRRHLVGDRDQARPDHVERQFGIA